MAKRIRITIDKNIPDYRKLKAEIRAITDEKGRWHKFPGGLSLETDDVTYCVMAR